MRRDTITVFNPPQQWELGQQVTHDGQPFIVTGIKLDAPAEATLLHGEYIGDLIIDKRTCEEAGHDWRTVHMSYSDDSVRQVCNYCHQFRTLMA